MIDNNSGERLIATLKWGLNPLPHKRNPCREREIKR